MYLLRNNPLIYVVLRAWFVSTILSLGFPALVLADPIEEPWQSKREAAAALGNKACAGDRSAIEKVRRAIASGDPVLMNNVVSLRAKCDVFDSISEPDAIEFQRLAAEAGYPIALSNYGIRLVKGWGVPVDADRGVQMLERSVDGGNGYAAAVLASEYATGEFLPRDLEKSRSFLRIAEQEGAATSRTKAARESLQSAEREASKGLRAALWTTAPATFTPETGSADGGGRVSPLVDLARVDLSWMAKRDELADLIDLTAQGDKSALEEFVARINAGETAAIGMISHGRRKHGLFGSMTEEKIAEFDKRAARDGFPPAVAEYGARLWLGLGVPHDDTQALKYYEQAARAGVGWAAAQVAHVSASRAVSSRDLEKAEMYLSLATDIEHRLRDLDRTEPGLEDRIAQAREAIREARERETPSTPGRTSDWAAIDPASSGGGITPVPSAKQQQSFDTWLYN